MNRTSSKSSIYDYNEVRIVLAGLKNNKVGGVDGQPAGPFKYCGEYLKRCMYELLSRIWTDKCVPYGWDLNVVYPNNPQCANKRVEFYVRD